MQAVKCRILHALDEAGRAPDAAWLLVVSKTFSAEAIRAAWQAGQLCFGESYLQEALAKIADLQDLPLEWHFIGPIQSNKTQAVAAHFSWVHSVDRAKIADRLAAARPDALPPLQVCIEVNISGEASKGGVMPQDALALARHIQTLPRLQLRGLMTIPAPTCDARPQFGQLRALLQQLNASGCNLDTLSMGMSDDLESAILEGATIVRVGSAIFGARASKIQP